jgi:hypothetical protein
MRVIRVCDAPQCDTFGYSSIEKSFICFDWLEKCFYKFLDNETKFVKCLENLKLNKAHIARYLNRFIILDWESPTIFIIEEENIAAEASFAIEGF